jgi:hypothetical protein
MVHDLLVLISGVVITLVLQETQGWSSSAACYITRLSTRLLPFDQRKETQKEWLEEIDNIKIGLGKLLYSVGFIFRASADYGGVNYIFNISLSSIILRVIPIILVLFSVWTAFTVYFGLSDLFSERMSSIVLIPISFAIFLFLISSHLLLSMASQDIVAIFLKLIWASTFVLSIFGAYLGNKQIIHSGVGVSLILSAISVLSVIILSRLLLEPNTRGDILSSKSQV